MPAWRSLRFFTSQPSWRLATRRRPPLHLPTPSRSLVPHRSFHRRRCHSHIGSRGHLSGARSQGGRQCWRALLATPSVPTLVPAPLLLGRPLSCPPLFLLRVWTAFFHSHRASEDLHLSGHAAWAGGGRWLALLAAAAPPALLRFSCSHAYSTHIFVISRIQKAHIGWLASRIKGLAREQSKCGWQQGAGTEVLATAQSEARHCCRRTAAAALLYHCRSPLQVTVVPPQYRGCTAADVLPLKGRCSAAPQ